MSTMLQEPDVSPDLPESPRPLAEGSPEPPHPRWMWGAGLLIGLVNAGLFLVLDGLAVGRAAALAIEVVFGCVAFGLAIALAEINIRVRLASRNSSTEGFGPDGSVEETEAEMWDRTGGFTR